LFYFLLKSLLLKLPFYITFSEIILKFRTIAMIFIVVLQTMFHIKCLGMFINFFHTRFNRHISTDHLVITIQPKTKLHFVQDIFSRLTFYNTTLKNVSSISKIYCHTSFRGARLNDASVPPLRQFTRVTGFLRNSLGSLSWSSFHCSSAIFYHRSLRSMIAQTRQHIITSSIVNPGASSLIWHLANYRVKEVSAVGFIFGN
jgi:hypothetical protein